MDRSGIFAQAGFAFQMNVFLKQVTELTDGSVARYEYLDDISASASLDELSGQIGLCDTQLFQVKIPTLANKMSSKSIRIGFLLIASGSRYLPFGFFIRTKKLFLSFLMLLPPINSSRCWIRGRKSLTGQTLQN